MIEIFKGLNLNGVFLLNHIQGTNIFFIQSYIQIPNGTLGNFEVLDILFSFLVL